MHPTNISYLRWIFMYLSDIVFCDDYSCIHCRILWCLGWLLEVSSEDFITPMTISCIRQFLFTSQTVLFKHGIFYVSDDCFMYPWNIYYLRWLFHVWIDYLPLVTFSSIYRICLWLWWVSQSIPWKICYAMSSSSIRCLFHTSPMTISYIHGIVHVSDNSCMSVSIEYVMALLWLCFCMY